jgi:uncharacterized protein YbaR (Trm112 family)
MIPSLPEGIDPRLLEVLRCPCTKSPLRLVSSAELHRLNQHVAQGGLYTRLGVRRRNPLQSALINTQGDWLYPIEDGIPQLLPDEAIACPLETDKHAG